MGPKGRSYEYSRPFHGTSADAAITGGRLLVRGPDTFSTRKGRCCSVAGAGREHISADDHTDTAMERPAQAGGVSAFFWVRICPCGGFPQIRRIVLFSRGVAGFVAMQGEPLPIPDEQIDNVKELLAKNIRCAAHPFLKVGQRVRIRGGSLEGLEGILVSHNGDRKLVISVNTIERSFSIGIDGYDVEVL